MLDAHQRRLIEIVAKRLERGENLFPAHWVKEEQITEQEMDDLRYYIAAAALGWLILPDPEQARLLKLGAEKVYKPLKKGR